MLKESIYSSKLNNLIFYILLTVAMIIFLYVMVFLLTVLPVSTTLLRGIVKPTYQINLLKPMTPGKGLNKWLADHPGWRVIQVSYMDYQAPWVLVEGVKGGEER